MTPSALRQVRVRFILIVSVVAALLYAAYWAVSSRPRWKERIPVWTDIAQLTRPVNVSQMMLDNPTKWDMFIRTIPQLQHAPGPASYDCLDSPSFGPLLMIGVFSTAAERKQRAVIRAFQYLPPASGGSGIDMRFILGRSADDSLQRAVEAEAELYGDMVILDVRENMNDGKTYAYFKWVADRMQEGQRPRFVMKADSDTFLVLPNVLHAFASLSCSDLIYWGTSWGSCLETCFPFYMRGMAYALSWPLVYWLAHPTSPLMRSPDLDGMEDARTGAYFLSLPPSPSPALLAVDLNVLMGDFDGLTIPTDINTVALHGMKEPLKWIETASRVMEVWRKAGREWAYPLAVVGDI